MSCFFFSSRRRHTRCLSDWSSDVCSSDLAGEPAPASLEDASLATQLIGVQLIGDDAKIGRASCRERVEISGVAPSLKKKKSRAQPTLPTIETTTAARWTYTHMCLDMRLRR